jgi:PBP1b-binding outer membrane lipoprotein LpoB
VRRLALVVVLCVVLAGCVGPGGTVPSGPETVDRSTEPAGTSPADEPTATVTTAPPGDSVNTK